MREDEVVMASKEFYDLLSNNTERKLFENVTVYYGDKNLKCSIDALKLSEFKLEISFKASSKDALDLITHGIERNLSVPSVLPNIKKSIITEMELDSSLNVKIIASVIS